MAHHHLIMMIRSECKQIIISYVKRVLTILQDQKELFTLIQITLGNKTIILRNHTGVDVNRDSVFGGLEFRRMSDDDVLNIRP